MPKTHYHSSGKIKIVPLVIATILATVAGVSAAIFYSTAGVPGKVNFGQICLMVILTVWLFGTYYLFKRYNHSRNLATNVVIGTCISLACWYYSEAGWIGLALLIPICMMFEKDYYCEKCGKYYEKKTSYIVEAKKFLHLAQQHPNYGFLPDMNFYDLPKREFDPSEELIRVEYYYCKSCESRPIASIYLCVWEKSEVHTHHGRRDYHRHSHGHHYADDWNPLTNLLDGPPKKLYRWEIRPKDPIVEGIYLDNKTGNKLSLLLGC